MPAPSLRHVVVAGGSPAGWSSLDGEAWQRLTHSLASAAAGAGVSHVVVRPYGPESADPGLAHTEQGGQCTVVVDPCGDGRKRVVNAAETLRSRGEPVTDVALAAELRHPADSEPDLAVVLGPATRLAPSLVWELAYCELVFLDVCFADLGGDVLARAFDAFARRHRRFGGLD